jgi:MYXO-CTERM domain-containing protein
MSSFNRSGILTALGFVFFVGFAPCASAAVIFQDTFDSEGTPGLSTLDYSPLANWAIGGTVDLIQSGDLYAITCAGGAGKCLDMDGTTGGTGTITTFTIFAQGTYQLSFDLSGNQRSGSDDTLRVVFGDLDETFTRSPADPFETITRTVNVGAAGAQINIFQPGASDQLGIILDNVVLEDTAASIPAPAAAGLLGLAALAVARRRRT